MGAVAVTVGMASAAEAAVASKAVGTYQTNGRVEQIAIAGNTAYLVGQFTSVRPAGAAAGTGEVARNRAAAFNLATGALLPWNPNANATVQTLAVDGSTVYLGGAFTTVGGRSENHLAAVDASTGAVVTAWKGGANAQVMSVALGNGVLYAGGSFTLARGTTRNHLAAFDLTAGDLTQWNPSADAAVNAVAVSSDGTRVFAGGSFQHIGTSVQRYLAALDPATGAPLAWASHPPAPVVDMAVDSSGVYAALTGSSPSGNGGQVNAYTPSTGAQRWIAGVDGNVQAVGLLNGLLYVGGHFANYCGPVAGSNVCRTPTVRNHLLALDEQTGALDAWHPTANGTLGVFAVAGSGGNLTIGGDFTKAGTIAQQGFAEFPTISDPTLTDTAGGQPTTAGSVTVTAAGSSSSGPGFTGYRYQTSTDNGTTWSASHDNHPTATVTAIGTTLVRFQAYDASGNTSNWVTDTVVIQQASTGSAQITFTASGTASVGTGGNVTVKGTYTCTGASSIAITGSLTQANGATGTFSVTVPCGVTTATKWQALAKHTGSTLFTAGTVTEDVSWSATDSQTSQPIGNSLSRSLTVS